jgi:hypothetical protein
MVKLMSELTRYINYNLSDVKVCSLVGRCQGRRVIGSCGLAAKLQGIISQKKTMLTSVVVRRSNLNSEILLSAPIFGILVPVRNVQVYASRNRCKNYTSQRTMLKGVTPWCIIQTLS